MQVNKTKVRITAIKTYKYEASLRTDLFSLLIT